MNTDRNGQHPQYYFMRLLIAACRSQPNGEINFKASQLDRVAEGERLLISEDDDSMIHIQVLPGRHAEVFVVGSDAELHTVASRPHLRQAEQPRRSRVLTDDIVAGLERQRLQDEALRRTANTGFYQTSRPMRQTAVGENPGPVPVGEE